MDKRSERPRLIEAIRGMGFGESLFEPPTPVADCDAALRSMCYLAFVTLVAPSESLLDSWLKWQERIADFRQTAHRLPRDLYLVLLLQQENQSAFLENIDRVSRDALICRKIVCVLGSGGYRAAIETWPFLTFASSTLTSPRALVNVLDGIKNAGYDPQLIDTFSKWISAEHARSVLAGSQPPALIPEPKLDTYSRSLPASEEAPHKMRLLTIKDFRGIRKMEIDLSADLVLIHGRNGTGKTSVFDALEWALLGEVEHIDDIAAEGDSRPPFINLFSEDGVAAVNLQLESAGTTVTLSRSIGLDGNRSLRFEERAYGDNRLALIDILGEQARNLNIGNLRDLTRSSNFLAQATLRRFFSKRPDERYAAVSYLLGTHDYAKFLKKLNDVREEFTKAVANAGSELSELAQQIELKQGDLRRFTSQLVHSPVGAELDSRIEQVLSLIGRDLVAFGSEISQIPLSRPLLFEEVKAFLDVAEQWQSVTSANLDKRLKDMAFVERSYALLHQQENQSREIRAELLALDTRDQYLKGELQGEEILRRQLDENLANFRLRFQSLNSATGAFQKLKDLGNSEPEVRRRILTYSQQLEEVAAKEQNEQGKRDAGRQDEANLLSSKKRLAAESATLQEQLHMIYGLQGRVNEATRYRDEAASIQSEVGANQADMAQLEAGLATADQEYAQIFAALDANAKALATSRSSLQDYRSLLSSLRTYLREPSCPLCGQRYESLDELRRHVDNSLEADPPELARMEKEGETFRRRLKLVTDTQDQLRQRMATAAANIRSNRRRLSDIESSLAEIRKLSIEAGFGDQEVDQSTVGSRRGTIEKQLQERASELAQIDAAYAVRKGEYSQFESAVTFLAEQREEIDGKLQLARQEHSQLTSLRSQLLHSVSVANTEEISDREREAAEQLTAVKKDMVTAEQERAVREGKITNIQAELSSLGKQKSTKEQQLRALSLETEQLKASASRIEGFHSATIAEARTEATVSLNRLKELASEIDNAKQVTSWLLARREANAASDQIESLNSQRQDLERSRDLDRNWEIHLTALSRMITSARHEAENWQLENYGPSISNLYKRFSAHPIFGNIKATVDPAKEEVRITAEVTDSLARFVKHPSEGVAPLRYFSEAQANVLALSVFLSNVLQQRWSKMTSVFMDDPVQNMDDLNSNAFIDTIRALTTSAGRQFVVATCDPHLYRLMLVKLACLNADPRRKRFSAYRLEGISVDGPNLVPDV